MKKSWFNHKKWFEICAITFKDKVEEMMRNANCFVILFHVNNLLHSFKEANESNPLLVH